MLSDKWFYGFLDAELDAFDPAILIAVRYPRTKINHSAEWAPILARTNPYDVC